MKKIFFIILISCLNLYAEVTFNCNTEYINMDGKRYLPPNNLKFFKITLDDGANNLNFITQNYKTRYKYSGFIPASKMVPSLGVSFEKEDRYVDIFNNGELYLGPTDNSGHMLKATCPSMHLNIRKDYISDNGEIVYILRLKK